MKLVNSALILVLFISITSCDNEKIDSSKPKVLDYYIDSYDVQGLEFKPESKIQYEYNESGNPSKYAVLAFNPNSGLQEEQRHFEFSYLNKKVSELKGYLVNQTSPYIKYTYQYLGNGKLFSIKENNIATGITSEATFAYSDNSVKITFVYSNGGGFEYEYDFVGENVVSDKTTRGSQLCSDGVYTYDNKINPFKNLGYIDYSLTGLSANNKLTESVNYVACAFPSVIPVAYVYQYDEDGFPTEVTTTFSNDNLKQKRTYSYK